MIKDIKQQEAKQLMSSPKKQKVVQSSMKGGNITKHKSLSSVEQNELNETKLEKNNRVSYICEQTQKLSPQHRKKDQQDFINYLFEAIDEDSNIYKFDMRQWVYFSKGADHVVFHNVCPQSKMADKVLIFKKVAVSKVDEQIFNHYMKDLLKDDIKKFLNKGIKIWPRTKQYQKVLSLLKQKKQELDFSTQKFTISTNVFYNAQKKWDIMLEFKPKSLMPSKYAEETIKNISQNYQINEQTLKKQIAKADIIQKLTWFKKVTCSGKKVTLCPLQIFAGIKYECNELDYTKTQLFKQYSQNFQANFINKLVNQTLKQSNVLRNIHKIMGVYNLPNLYGIFQQVNQAHQLNVSLPQIISSSKQLFPIQQTAQYLSIQNCFEQTKFETLKYQSLQQKWERFYRLLVFRCWNDVSLVVKIALDKQKKYILESQIFILDFELWHSHTVQNRTTSEKQYLRRYLEYKGLINSYSRENHNSIMQNREFLIEKNKSFQIGYEIIDDKNQRIQINNRCQLINFLPIFKKSMNIKYIYLDNNKFTIEEIKLLVKVEQPTLNVLSLDSNKLGVEGCIQLAKGNWPNLLLLNIKSNNIRNEGLKALTKSNWKKLEQISLDWNQITQHGIQSLNYWENLTKICLTFCKIGEIGARSLIKGNHKKLKQLNLYNNNLKANGLMQLIKGDWPLLQQLNLSKTQLCKDSLPDISFCRWSRLRSLDLSINRFMCFNSSVLHRMNLKNIQQLKLCYNKIRIEGVKILVQIQFTCLKKLDLYFNKLKNPGLEVLCSKKWLHLEQLNLTRNDISDFGVSFIRSESFPKLQKLFLYHNKISLAGVKTIMEKSWPKLRMLDVAQNGISLFQFKKNQREITRQFKVPVKNLVLD